MYLQSLILGEVKSVYSDLRNEHVLHVGNMIRWKGSTPPAGLGSLPSPENFAQALARTLSTSSNGNTNGRASNEATSHTISHTILQVSP